MSKRDNTDTRDIEIALTLSGGGYRASIFHLGVLSYLYELKLDNNSRLIDHVNVMSTISGGSITGLWYMLGLASDKSFPDRMVEYFNLIKKTNIADKLLEKLAKNRRNSQLSLIKELANVYDEEFLKGKTFGDLVNIAESKHVHHYAAYSTDITNSQPFRFQAVHSRYGDIVEGNDKCPIQLDEAKNMRLAEILASSSCFPFVFEPLNYPRDFRDIEPASESAQTNMQTQLMDGGIIDNQGVDYLIEANAQMVVDEEVRTTGIDMAIISDAASPAHEDPVTPPIEHGRIMKFVIVILRFFFYASLLFLVWKLLSQLKHSTINMLQWWLGILSILSYVSGTYYYDSSEFGQIVSYSFMGTLIVLFCLIVVLKYITPDSLKRSTDYKIPSGLIWKIGFFQYYRLITSRIESFKKVVSTVMMGHMREVNLQMISSNPRWENRFVIPAIADLSSNGTWKSDNVARSFVDGATNLMSIVDEVCNFESTLWFSESDKDMQVPEKLFVIGRATMCYSLLLWSKKNEGNKRNMIKVLSQLKSKSVKKQLKKDWSKFKTIDISNFDITKIA